MQLIKLEIHKAGTLIRNILFKPGLNLIIDTPIDARTESGNNVGKTTVLRLIDYCLGSTGKDIWEDPEFKKINQEVYDFLHENTPVSVSLTISADGRVLHTLERRFVGAKKNGPAFFVNGQPINTIGAYNQEVKKILFGSTGSKPTLRQLMPKFVRSSPAKMSRTLKFGDNFDSDVIYESIHLFLFGFFDVYVLSERPRLDALLKKQNRDFEAITRNREEGELEQLIFHLQNEIFDIERITALRGEVSEIALHANRITSVRAEAASLTGELSHVEAEIASLNLSLSEFKRDFDSIDERVVASIYKEADLFIPELHSKWKDLSKFVISLRQRKERFIASQKDILIAQRMRLLTLLDQLENIEATEIESISDSAEFQQAIALRTDLLDKTKQLGSLEQSLRDIKELKSSINHTIGQVDEMQQVIENGKTLLQERIKIFNKHFSKYSKTLYGEQYLLHTEENNQGTLVFKLSAVGANVGTGKKTSQTAAFDFAYCNFVTEAEIPFPKFVCHDGLEAIHDNQLQALLTTANTFGGQLIVATLRDKLPKLPEDFVKDNTVLELSQRDMLFRF